MKCNNCGNEVSNGDSFCMKCGFKIDYSSNNTACCPNCGLPVADSDLFCVGCGAKLNLSSGSLMSCPNCGSPVSDDDMFCESCGNPLHANPPAYYRQDNNVYSTPDVSFKNNEPSKGKKTGIIIIAVVVVVIIAALTGWYLIKGQKPVAEDDSIETTNVDKPAAKKVKSKKKQEQKKEIKKIDSNIINDIIRDNSQYTKYGIYVYNADNEYEFGYNEDDVFLASAMGQIVILDTLADYVSKNQTDIETEKIQFNYMPNGKEAPTSKDEDGKYLTLKQYIEDIAIYGDNNKSNTLVDYLAGVGNKSSGFEVINGFLSKNGYPNTKINRKTFINQKLVDTSVTPNVTTAQEIAKLFDNLMNTKCFGSKNYLNNIFRCFSSNGQPIGLKKYIPDEYISCNVNAFTSQTTNDVALISDGKTDIVVAILSETDEDKTKYENNDSRLEVKRQLLEYILETQFEDVDE